MKPDREVIIDAETFARIKSLSPRERFLALLGPIGVHPRLVIETPGNLMSAVSIKDVKQAILKRDGSGELETIPLVGVKQDLADAYSDAAWRLCPPVSVDMPEYGGDSYYRFVVVDRETIRFRHETTKAALTAA